MLLASLEQIDEGMLTRLCAERCPESSTLDFKRDLPGGSDKDKHELLKDVCALANTDGGDLVYGIDEQAGAAASLTPITAESADSAKRRLSQVVDAGIEPRVPGLQMTHVAVTGGYTLILRVPPSYQGPHSVRVNNLRRFVMRNGTSTSDLTVEQLRAAYDRTASLGNQARRFIAERNQGLMERRTPKRLLPGPIKAVHLVPIAGIAGRQPVELQAVYSNSFTRFLESDWGGGSRTFNLDGLVVYPGSTDEGHYGYAQIFRNGLFEAASLGGGTYQPPVGPEKLIVWSGDLTKFFRERTATFLAAAREWGLSGPAVLAFSLLHVHGYELGIDSPFPRRTKPETDRPHLLVPELWIENLESAILDDLVRPLLDTLWQGFGVERCLDYDQKSGEYRPRR